MGFLRDFGGVDTPHSVSTPEKKAFDKKNPCKWTLRRLERVFSVRRYFPSESIQGQKIKMARNRNRKKKEERREKKKREGEQSAQEERSDEFIRLDVSLSEGRLFSLSFPDLLFFFFLFSSLSFEEEEEEKRLSQGPSSGTRF